MLGFMASPWKTLQQTLQRRLGKAAETGSVEEATAALRVATRQLDKAVSKGIIHKNQAANRKSALAKRLATLDQG